MLGTGFIVLHTGAVRKRPALSVLVFHSTWLDTLQTALYIVFLREASSEPRVPQYPGLSRMAIELTSKSVYSCLLTRTSDHLLSYL